MKWGFAQKEAVPVGRDWYYDADPLLRREYDAFGPWIGIVRCFDDMPPRFQHAYEELKPSTFLFKIPIKADRRSVRPGMDLYRAVLAVSEDRVVVLDWDGSSETRYESPVDQIQAIRIDQDLLPATLSLLLMDGRTVSLGYSSVSDKDIEQVVSFLRKHMNPDAAIVSEPPASIPERPPIGIADSFYLSMWWKHGRRSPTARVLYCEQPGARLGRLRTSLGCLFVDMGSELVIIHRGRFIRAWLEAVYSSTEIYIPWSAIESVELVQQSKGRKAPIPTVKITVQGHAIKVESFAPSGKLEQLVTEMANRTARWPSP